MLISACVVQGRGFQLIISDVHVPKEGPTTVVTDLIPSLRLVGRRNFFGWRGSGSIYIESCRSKFYPLPSDSRTRTRPKTYEYTISPRSARKNARSVKLRGPNTLGRIAEGDNGASPQGIFQRFGAKVGAHPSVLSGCFRVCEIVPGSSKNSWGRKF